MVDTIKLGGGGRLYKDAREASNGHEPGEDDDGAVPPPAYEPKLHSETLPNEPPVQRWVVEPILPPEPPETPKPRFDWRQLYSTFLEITGIGILSYGLSELYVWLGIAVFGACVIVLGVAVGLPTPPKPRKRKAA